MTRPNLNNPFPGDTYDTPEDTKLSLSDLLLLHTRFSFYIRNFYVFGKTGSQAKKGVLTDQRKIDNSYENIRITESCGGKFHLRGLDNLSKTGPAVIIGNHMSLLETAVMHSFLLPRRDFCFVIKQQLFNIPFFGDIMRDLRCIGVGRENPRDDLRAILDEGKERLASGKSVVIFPQSTRSEIFNPAHFNTVGVKLARAAGVPVIPLALRTDFLANGTLIKDLGPIRRKLPIYFEFGEPVMEIKGSGKEEQAHIVEFIISHLKEWGCTVMENEK